MHFLPRLIFLYFYLLADIATISSSLLLPSSSSSSLSSVNSCPTVTQCPLSIYLVYFGLPVSSRARNLRIALCTAGILYEEPGNGGCPGVKGPGIHHRTGFGRENGGERRGIEKAHNGRLQHWTYSSRSLALLPVRPSVPWLLHELGIIYARTIFRVRRVLPLLFYRHRDHILHNTVPIIDHHRLQHNASRMP